MSTTSSSKSKSKSNNNNLIIPQLTETTIITKTKKKKPKSTTITSKKQKQQITTINKNQQKNNNNHISINPPSNNNKINQPKNTNNINDKNELIEDDRKQEIENKNLLTQYNNQNNPINQKQYGTNWVKVYQNIFEWKKFKKLIFNDEQNIPSNYIKILIYLIWNQNILPDDVQSTDNSDILSNKKRMTLKLLFDFLYDTGPFMDQIRDDDQQYEHETSLQSIQLFNNSKNIKNYFGFDVLLANCCMKHYYASDSMDNYLHAFQMQHICNPIFWGMFYFVNSINDKILLNMDVFDNNTYPKQMTDFVFLFDIPNMVELNYSILYYEIYKNRHQNAFKLNDIIIPIINTYKLNKKNSECFHLSLQPDILRLSQPVSQLSNISIQESNFSLWDYNTENAYELIIILQNNHQIIFNDLTKALNTCFINRCCEKSEILKRFSLRNLKNVQKNNICHILGINNLNGLDKKQQEYCKTFINLLIKYLLENNLIDKNIDYLIKQSRKKKQNQNNSKQMNDMNFNNNMFDMNTNVENKSLKRQLEKYGISMLPPLKKIKLNKIKENQSNISNPELLNNMFDMDDNDIKMNNNNIKKMINTSNNYPKGFVHPFEQPFVKNMKIKNMMIENDSNSLENNVKFSINQQIRQVSKEKITSLHNIPCVDDDGGGQCMIIYLKANDELMQLNVSKQYTDLSNIQRNQIQSMLQSTV